MKKTAMFVFNGDPMCFIHVLLNTLDMDGRGDEARIVVEGSATKLIPDLDKKENPMNQLWVKVKEKGLVAGVCKACATKMGTAKDAEAQDLPLLAEMSGHPSMARFRDELGYEILTF